MAINVKGEMILPASGDAAVEYRRQIYLEHKGLKRRETRAIESQCDTMDFTEYRDSSDNGKTWGEWVRTKPFAKEKIGEDEIEEGGYPNDSNVWNPVHKHYLTLCYQIIYVGGYDISNNEYWQGGRGPVFHSFVEIREENEKIRRQFVAYEKGAEFEKDNYRETDYLSTNMGFSTGLCVLKNGDIIFGLCAPNDICCKIAGYDVNDIIPSLPKQVNSMIVCRGNWNNETSCYNFTFAKPMILDDRISSRGISEPIFAELEGGKILGILRGSNVREESWNSRISPFAPSYKFYTVSEDGGKTFSVPMPWHFNTREVVYSSSTYSLFIRSTKNGKLYWIGNITEPWQTYGNHKRYPLYIVEVDDTWGHAKKDTLTVIDTRREGEYEYMQLSNFSLLEDRETKDIEIYLAKLGQFAGRSVYDCENWKYIITVE